MSELTMFYTFIEAICAPFDAIFLVVFCFVPGFLRTFSISMLVLTIGKILDLFDKKSYKLIKWVLYFGFIVYSIYLLGLIANLKTLSLLDITTLTFGVIAPICMFLIGKQLGNLRIKGHKIFTYYMLMLLYLIFAIVWKFFFPAKVVLTLVFVYFFASVISIYLLTNLKGEIH